MNILTHSQNKSYYKKKDKNKMLTKPQKSVNKKKVLRDVFKFYVDF